MNENYPEEDVEEQIEENVGMQREANEEYDEDNSPTFNKSDDLYSLYWKVINMKDSSKVGNLDRQELGMLDISVRDLQKIAMTAIILGEPKFAEWLTNQAQIILKTSSSKKGWLTELFVTVKKFASKEKRLGIPTEGMVGEGQQKKGGFWSRFKR